jgi:hypothetical protein
MGRCGCETLEQFRALSAEKLFELVTTGTPVEVVQSLSSVTPPAKSATAEDATAE